MNITTARLDLGLRLTPHPNIEPRASEASARGSASSPHFHTVHVLIDVSGHFRLSSLHRSLEVQLGGISIELGSSCVTQIARSRLDSLIGIVCSDQRHKRGTDGDAEYGTTYYENQDIIHRCVLS